jgi:hypothetical protein
MDSRRFSRPARLLAALGLVLASAAASADPVRWSFDQCVFSDGGELTGSFVYDTATGLVSDVSAQLTMGLGYLYPDLVPGGPTTSFVSSTSKYTPYPGEVSNVTLLDDVEKNWLQLNFAAPLTDAGGTVALTTNTFVNDPYPQIQPHGAPMMYLTSGEVVGTPVSVPEPAGLWVLVAGIAVVGWRMRPNPTPVRNC